MSVEKVEKVAGGERVTLQAVTGGTPEENSYAKNAPNATLKMTVENPDVVGSFFREGEKYFLDISRANAPVPKPPLPKS